jgi:hypothetical protein
VCVGSSRVRCAAAAWFLDISLRPTFLVDVMVREFFAIIVVVIRDFCPPFRRYFFLPQFSPLRLLSSTLTHSLPPSIPLFTLFPLDTTARTLNKPKPLPREGQSRKTMRSLLGTTSLLVMTLLQQPILKRARKGIVSLVVVVMRKRVRGGWRMYDRSYEWMNEMNE